MANGGLEVDQDLAFQYREWRVQTIARVLFALFILAALLGVFGSGPLSRAEWSAGNASVEYPRFARLDRTMEYRFDVPAQDGRASLVLPNELLERVTIESWAPEPGEQRSTA